MEKRRAASLPEGTWFLLGLTRSGKTTLLFDILDELDARAVIVAPAVTNPRMMTLDYVSDEDPTKLEEYYEAAEGHLLVEARKQDPDIFKTLEKFKLVVFDDVATLLTTSEMKEAFINFLRGVGWRHQFCICTTHRITGDFKPTILYLIRKAYFVGPIADIDEQKTLYRKSTVSRTVDFDTFAHTLLTLKPYDYKAKNADGYYIFIAP